MSKPCQLLVPTSTPATSITSATTAAVTTDKDDIDQHRYYGSTTSNNDNVAIETTDTATTSKNNINKNAFSLENTRVIIMKNVMTSPRRTSSFVDEDFGDAYETVPYVLDYLL